MATLVFGAIGAAIGANGLVGRPLDGLSYLPRYLGTPRFRSLRRRRVRRLGLSHFRALVPLGLESLRFLLLHELDVFLEREAVPACLLPVALRLPGGEAVLCARLVFTIQRIEPLPLCHPRFFLLIFSGFVLLPGLASLRSSLDQARPALLWPLQVPFSGCGGGGGKA